MKRGFMQKKVYGIPYWLIGLGLVWYVMKMKSYGPAVSGSASVGVLQDATNVPMKDYDPAGNVPSM